MKLKSTLALAALACHPGVLARAGAAAGREQERDPDRHHPGPVRAAGGLRQAGPQRHAAAHRRTQRAAGSIHGRKLKLIRGLGYDPKKAVLAAQKLVNQDKVFIVAGHLGTAQNMAAMPVQFEKNVINFMPITAAREMYEP
jgi:branched-chain amino acid transport system substrate-binding protein